MPTTPRAPETSTLDTEEGRRREPTWEAMLAAILTMPDAYVRARCLAQLHRAALARASKAPTMDGFIECAVLGAHAEQAMLQAQSETQDARQIPASTMALVRAALGAPMRPRSPVEDYQLRAALIHTLRSQGLQAVDAVVAYEVERHVMRCRLGQVA